MFLSYLCLYFLISKIVFRKLVKSRFYIYVFCILYNVNYNVFIIDCNLKIFVGL